MCKTNTTNLLLIDLLTEDSYLNRSCMSERQTLAHSSFIHLSN